MNSTVLCNASYDAFVGITPRSCKDHAFKLCTFWIKACQGRMARMAYVCISLPLRATAGTQQSKASDAACASDATQNATHCGLKQLPQPVHVQITW